MTKKYNPPHCIYCGFSVYRKERRGSKRVVCKKLKCQEKAREEKNRRVREFRKKQPKKLKTVICEFCMDKFEVKGPRWATKCCSKPECQEAKKDKLRSQRRLWQAKDQRKIITRKNINNGRKCRNCGGNTEGNYFYCPSCLEEISVHLSGPEEVYFGCDGIIDGAYKGGG